MLARPTAAARAGLNVVAELLRGHEGFYIDEHYPPGDVSDSASDSLYYYHAHRDVDLEHGHFHLFTRDTARSVRRVDAPHAHASADRLVHLVAISMDDWGEPQALFTTNRWVTGEDWAAAAEVRDRVARFEIDHAYPSWPVNRWLTAMLQLYGAHLDVLLAARDATIDRWAKKRPGDDPLAARSLEVLSWLPVSIDAWADQLETGSLKAISRR